MSFYRTILATVAAIALASPVFADDAATTTTTESTTATQTTDSTSTSTTEAKVNLNTASAKDLMKVKGLNAAKARAIVSYRKKHGNFKSIEDLANVKGFKKMNADSIKSIEDQLTIE